MKIEQRIYNQITDFKLGRNKKIIKEATKVFESENEIVKNFISEIYKQVGNSHISFDTLKYYTERNEVYWSGTLASIDWSVIYSDSDEAVNGFFITAENEKLSIDDVTSLAKLNQYFLKVWMPAVRNAILNKELSE